MLSNDPQDLHAQNVKEDYNYKIFRPDIWGYYEQQEYDRLQKADQYTLFRIFALRYYNAPYDWGKEWLLGVDCSGTLCGPLLKMGYLIRTTATDLYKRLFTIPVVGHHDEHIAALFVVTTEPTPHGDRTLPAGGVTHVMPFVGENVVLDASWKDKVRLRSLTDVFTRYKTSTTILAVRALNWRLLRELHENRSMAFGIDDELLEFIDE